MANLKEEYEMKQSRDYVLMSLEILFFIAVIVFVITLVCFIRQGPIIIYY